MIRMTKKIEEKSTKALVCDIIIDTVKSKGDEIYFLENLKDQFEGNNQINSKIKKLISDSKEHKKILNDIKNIANCE